jgi:hypothetical protein
VKQKIIRAYQGPTEAAAIEKNGAEALRVLDEAHARGVDFACLPECYLSGYGAPDQIRAGAISVRSEWFTDWLRQCKRFGEMVSIVGFFKKRGSRIPNSAASYGDSLTRRSAGGRARGDGTLQARQDHGGRAEEGADRCASEAGPVRAEGDAQADGGVVRYAVSLSP